MNKIRWLVCVVLALAGLCPDATYAQAPAGAPSVDEILKKYVQAVGGRAALEKVKSRVSKGVLERGEVGTLDFEILAKAPNKFRFEVFVPEMGSVIQAYDGAVAWDYNFREGAQELSGSARGNRVRNAEFYREVNLRQMYTKLSVTSTTKIGALDVYIVEGIPADGFPDRYYFAAESGLLLRRDSKYEGDQGVVSFETYYEDYREVDGIQLAFAYRRTGPDSSFTLRFTEIRHNLPIEDAKFIKPANP